MKKYILILGFILASVGINYVVESGNVGVNYAIAPLLIPLITLALSAASSVYGEVKNSEASNKLRREQGKLLERQKTLGDLYESEMSKSYTDTAEGSSIMKQVNDQYNRSLSQAKGSAIRGGASPEAEIAQKGNIQNKYNEVLNRVAGNGTQYKMQVGDKYNNALQQLMEGNKSLYGSDVASWGNLIQGGSQSFLNTLGTTNWEDMFANGGGGGNALASGG